MLKSLLVGFAAVSLSVFVLPIDTGVRAGGLECATPVHVNATLFEAAAADFAQAPISQRDQAEATIRLAQGNLSAASKFPSRVPANKTYQVQLPNQTAFTKFTSGQALPGLDCIEVNCPASFPPETTCWRCVEQVKAPSSGGSRD